MWFMSFIKQIIGQNQDENIQDSEGVRFNMVLPKRLSDKLEGAKKELMLTKSAIVVIALNQYIDEKIGKNGRQNVYI